MDRDMLQSPREDAAAADYDADWEQLPTQDISRVYWELVDEGDVCYISSPITSKIVLTFYDNSRPSSQPSSMK